MATTAPPAPRYLAPSVTADLAARMVFVGGPRQVGKTTFALSLRDGQPEFAVECKSGERNASPTCRYVRERTAIPRFYQVHLGAADFGDAAAGTRVLPFPTFCRELALP